MAFVTRTDVAVERLDVSTYTVPTDEPESDGTAQWDSTTIVVVMRPSRDCSESSLLVGEGRSIRSCYELTRGVRELDPAGNGRVQDCWSAARMLARRGCLLTGG